MKFFNRVQVPNFEIYYEAICLLWIREWITLQNQKLLLLEGFNKVFGWHAYLFYEKEKADKAFKHHYIRNNLLQVWSKYKKYLPEARPLWITPKEVIYKLVGNKEGIQ